MTPMDAPAPGGNQLLALYADMLLIRRAEERLSVLFANGEVPGFIHLSIGQEAVPVGVMSALTTEDSIASTHRGHGHALAKGLKLEGFFAELLARDEGLCRGRGGSMHVADLSVGMLGANGIVGAGLSIALGSALAHKRLGRHAVAVAFFGDGALGEGLLHECLNLASLWRLPLLFVCENNGWSEFLPSSRQIAFTLAGLAPAYGIPHTKVDGNDVAAVSAAAAAAVAQVRDGAPAVLECVTTRVRGHYEGDAQKYRDPAEVEALAARDPLRIAAARLERLGIGADRLQGVLSDVDRRIEAAIAVARAGTAPDFAAAREDVYTPAEAP
ncbi:MAG: thiamine pyrophosphate-dependent dehydrogenase E1 component subunit alpha [Rhodospirillales bacterium]|nr:thiamine pyrophosphate-dependent dehydrogenase E1 component subunit alpha [Rhodospirillales bacterium]